MKMKPLAFVMNILKLLLSFKYHVLGVHPTIDYNLSSKEEMVMIRWIVTIIWWLCWASLETSTSWKSFGSILVSSDNNSDSKSSIQANGLVNKSHVVTSGKYFLFNFIKQKFHSKFVQLNPFLKSMLHNFQLN